MKKKKAITWGVIGLVSITLVGLGISYAYWFVVHQQTNENVISTDCFKLFFEEDVDTNISLLESYPMSDADGSSLTPYTFKISNGCNVKAKYTIRMEIDNSSILSEQYIKSMLNKGAIKKLSDLDETTPSLDNASKSFVLESMTINAGETREYELRLWIDGGVSYDNSEVMNKIFQGKITILGDYDPSYTEDILNGTDPVLADGLIPVVISDTGVVTKADTTTEWYSYEDKIWANAVILEDDSISYDVGETIPESNIESYFVWIPRYRYLIFDNGMYYELSSSVINASQEIQVVFENRETKISKGTKEGDWLTHPAFTAFDVNGMWVGKFETGYKGATSTTAAEVNANDSSKIQIKPNVYSWRYIQVANAHLSSYNYKREYDSHMMKNTEWGAVAYLQHSKYGSISSVRINNNGAYITGYSAVTEPTCGITVTVEECNMYESTALGVDGTITINYFSTKSVVSSTTGNYSGIYDMSGGTHEYVMGVVVDKNGVPMSGRNSISNSGFNGPFSCSDCDSDTSGLTELTTGINFPDAKYYDIYTYAENNQIYNRRILGDATAEMGPFATYTYGNVNRRKNSWYADEANFIYFDAPWMNRGGNRDNGSSAGVFAVNSTYGMEYNRVGFRVVLVF